MCLLFVGLLLVGSWWAWRHPSVGHADHFSRGLLLVAPSMVALLSLAALPKDECLRARLRFSSRGLLPVWFALFLLYAAGFHALMILAVIGRPVQTTAQWILCPVGLFYIGLGNNLSKCRDDFFYRIRTPWTTRSELSWNRTNRLGARIYVVSGLAVCAGILAGVSVKWLAILVGIFGVGQTAIFWGYSYLLWRGDPEKTAFTRPDRRNFPKGKGAHVI
jgi:hypothetical protein